MFEKFELRQDIFVGDVSSAVGFGQKEDTVEEKILKLIYKELKTLGSSSTLESYFHKGNGLNLIVYKREIEYFKWGIRRLVNEQGINFTLVFPDGEPKITVSSYKRYNKLITTVTCGTVSFELSPQEKSKLQEAAISWEKLAQIASEKQLEEKIDLRLKSNE